MEKLIGSLFGFVVGTLVVVVWVLLNSVADLEARLDKVERINEVQNGVIVDFLYSDEQTRSKL